MNSLWKIVRTVMAIVGGLLVFGGIGTSDYYLLELEQPEPTSVMPTIIIGVLMILPLFIHLFCENRKEKSNDKAVRFRR